MFFDLPPSCSRNTGMFDQTCDDTITQLAQGTPVHIGAHGGMLDRMAGQVRLDNTDKIVWAELVKRVADTQDAQAFTKLFEHFAPRVKAFLMKSGADPTTAEECAQDVMATVWHKAGQFDPTRASAATWIFTIARNRRIDMLRRDRRPEPEDLPWGPDAEPDQLDVLALQQETDKLAQAMNALPEKQRKMIESAYFGDLSHNEIADQTGLPLGTIKSRIRLALERLRHSMT